jgi:hypothetical protein
MPITLLAALDDFAASTGRLRPASEILAERRSEEPSGDPQPWWTDKQEISE